MSPPGGRSRDLSRITTFPASVINIINFTQFDNVMKNLFLSAAANTLKTADIWEPVSVISCASNFLTMGNKTNEYNYIMKWWTRRVHPSILIRGWVPASLFTRTPLWVKTLTLRWKSPGFKLVWDFTHTYVHTYIHNGKNFKILHRLVLHLLHYYQVLQRQMQYLCV